MYVFQIVLNFEFTMNLYVKLWEFKWVFGQFECFLSSIVFSSKFMFSTNYFWNTIKELNSLNYNVRLGRTWPESKMLRVHLSADKSVNK